jgi:hypothetical protein
MQKILQGIMSIAQGSDHSWYSLSYRSDAIYVLTLTELITTPLVESLKQDINPVSA